MTGGLGRDSPREMLSVEERDTFTVINHSNGQDTAMEIIFIPQAFRRLYVSLIHTVRLV